MTAETPSSPATPVDGATDPRRDEAPPEVVLAPQKGFDHYRYILENNIFSRNRTPGRTADDLMRDRERESQAPPPADPRSFFKLIGVSEPDERRVAFFRDTRSGQVTRLEVDGELGGVKIVSITLDGVSYSDEEGGEVKIVVGKMLNGADGVSGSSFTSYSSSGPGGTISTGSSVAPSSGSGSASEEDERRRKILEELLARRRQENE
ncbi:MAG: hypothetical protein ACYTGQ_03515 [Planctomycetota bacterium]